MCMRCCRLIPLFLALLLSGCGPSLTTTPTAKSSALQRVSVQAGELEYRVVGRGEPVLLIHGSIFADVFTPMLNDPSLRDYRLVTYNRRGYAGSTRASAPFTIEQQAADAIALLDRLGIGRAHIVGQSYGGAIALELARRYPQRVASLALLEPAVPALGTIDPQLMEGLTSAFGLYQQGDARSALIRFSNTVAPGSWDALTVMGATALQEQAVADAATFFEIELPALQQWPFTAEDAKQLSVPALVMYGEESKPAFRQSSKELVGALPRAEEMMVFGAGHELQMKQPHAVAEALGKFFEKNAIN